MVASWEQLPDQAQDSGGGRDHAAATVLLVQLLGFEIEVE